jgi:hypothetical protein
VATAVDQINEEVLYRIPFPNPLTIRVKMTTHINAHLRMELNTKLLQGYLELNIDEMKDNDIAIYFNEARRVIKEDGIRMFTHQLGIFRDLTSIITRIATLASLTNRKSWPILSFTACLPLLDHLLGMIPWEGLGKKDRRTLFINSNRRLL